LNHRTSMAVDPAVTSVEADDDNTGDDKGSGEAERIWTDV
jgi:hypothetical protein